MRYKKILSGVVTIATAVVGLVPLQTTASLSPIGTNIKGADGTIYLITPEYTKRPYTSAGAFQSYGFNGWSGVKNATAEDMNLPVGSFIPPQNGRVLCSDRYYTKGTCYLISNGMKLGFTSENVFRSQGYSFNRALTGDVSFVPEGLTISDPFGAHKPGSLIDMNKTIYLAINNGLMAFPSKETFESWGYSFADVVQANSADYNLPVFGSVANRAPGELNYSLTQTNQQFGNPSQTSTVNAKVYGTNPSNNIRYVTAGKQNAALLSFSIYASPYKDLYVQGFEFEIKKFPSEDSVDGMVSLETVQDNADPNVGTNISSSLGGKRVTTTFNGKSINIRAGQAREFTVYASISSNLPTDYLSITMKRVMNVDNDKVEGDDFLNGVIHVTGLGTQPPVVSQGQPSVELSAYNPKSTVYAGIKDVELFSFVIKAPYNNSVTIQQVGLEFGGTIAPSQISDLSVFHYNANKNAGSNSGNTLPYNSILFAINPPIYIAAGGSAELIIMGKLNTSAIGYTIQPKLTQIWTGLTSSSAALATVSGVPLTGSMLNISQSSTYVPKITVTSPKDGDVLNIGEYRSIIWDTPTLLARNLKIVLHRKTGTSFESQVIAQNVPNTGTHFWYVSPSLQSGQYYITINDPADWEFYDDSSGYFTINNPNFPVNSSFDRDLKRLSDIRQLASALELYFNDYNTYPLVLNSVSPTYIGVIPTAPTPADGSCSTNQNSYVYTSTSANTYWLSFCLGSANSGYAAGYRVLSPQGIK